MDFLPHSTRILSVVFATVLSLLSLSAVPSQLSVDVKAYSAADGLSHQHAYQTFQDSRGILWFVTANGLNAFDGAHFYYALEWPLLKSPHEISIRLESPTGYLWIMSPRGEQPCRLLNIRTRKLVPLSMLIDIPLVGTPTDITMDRAQRLIVLNTKGECWIRLANNKWKKIQTGLKGLQFIQSQPAGDLIWVGGFVSDLKPMVFKAFTNSGKLVLDKTIASVRTYQKLEGDKLWIGGNDRMGFIHADGSEQWISLASFVKEQTWPFSFDFLYDGFEADEERVWIAKAGEILLWNIRTNQEKRIATISSGKQLKLGAHHFFKDRQNNYWISGIQGVSRFRVLEDRFTRINWIDPTLQVNYFQHSARGIVEGKDGGIYMLSGPSLHRWDPVNKQLSPPLLSPITISPLICDKQSGTIFSASGAKVNYFDPMTKQVSQKTLAFEKGAQKFDFSEYWSMLEDGSGYWMGNDKSVFYLNPSNQKCTLFEKYNQFESLRGSEIYFMQREHPKGVWLLSNTGLYEMHPTKGIIARYAEDAKGSFKLPATNFRHYVKDPVGIYWMATTKGLLRWNRTTGATRLYTTRDGLSNDNLYAVYQDAYGYLWLNSDLGIMQFHPPTESVRYFTVDDGICNNEGNRISHAVAKDGTLYFGSLNGVTAFHPRDFVGDFKKQAEYPLVLMKATTADRMHAEKDLLEHFYQKQKITLQPGERFLNLQFGLPDFESLDKTEFRYRIRGVDSSWIQTKSPVIQLLGLGYGAYTLEITAKAGSGKYSDQIFSLPIRVLAPVYLRWPFLLIFGLVVAGFLILQFRRKWDAIHKQQVALEREVAKRTQTILEDKMLIEKQAGLLKRQNEEKNRFFANVTHEFRTPLSLVMGPVSAVMKRPYLQNKDQKMLQLASQNASRLLGLVDDILLLASLETRGIQAQLQHVDPELFLQNIIAEFRVLAGQKEIELQYTNLLEPGLMLQSDPRLLRILLSNLLSNAIKYTHIGGMITVGLNREEQRWTIRVADNGRGIHPEDLPHIFERFYQTQRQEVLTTGGTGVGLALVKELTELMGGRIEVSSKQGRGSVFTVTLPLKEVKENASPAVPPVQAAGDHQAVKQELGAYKRAAKQLPAVLVVEDDPGIRQFLQILLDDTYVMHLASNGQEALALLNQGIAPELILTDIMMPVLDGYELIQELKKHPHYRFIPVIALTARTGEDDRLAALQLGVDDYLVKPFDESSLQAVMASLVERYREKRKEGEALLDKVRAEVGVSTPFADNAWLEKLRVETHEHLANPSFSVDYLAGLMLMGRTMFYKETKRLTGLTPNQYILEARLMRARFMLENQPQASLKKVLQQVGLKDEGNFIQAFKKRFGYPPAHFMR